MNVEFLSGLLKTPPSLDALPQEADHYAPFAGFFAAEGNYPALRKLLNHCKQETRPALIKDAFLSACRYGQHGVANKLLDNVSADLKEKTNYFQQAMYAACEGGSVQILSKLMSLMPQDEQVALVSAEKGSPVTNTVHFCRAEATQYLLSKIPDVTARGRPAEKELFSACLRGDAPTIEALLNNLPTEKQSRTLLAGDHNSLMGSALAYGTPETFDLMLSHIPAAEFNITLASYLGDIAKNPDSQILEKALALLPRPVVEEALSRDNYFILRTADTHNVCTMLDFLTEPMRQEAVVYNDGELARQILKDKNHEAFKRAVIYLTPDETASVLSSIRYLGDEKALKLMLDQAGADRGKLLDAHAVDMFNSAVSGDHIGMIHYLLKHVENPATREAMIRQTGWKSTKSLTESGPVIEGYHGDYEIVPVRYSANAILATLSALNPDTDAALRDHVLSHIQENIRTKLSTPASPQHHLQNLGSGKERWVMMTGKEAPTEFINAQSPFNFNEKLYAELLPLMKVEARVEPGLNPELASYKLATLCDDMMQVSRYMQAQVQKSSQTPFKDATRHLVFPTHGVWDKKTWRERITLYGDSVAQLLPYVPEVEQYVKTHNAHCTTAEKITLATMKPSALRDLTAKVNFSRYAENPELANYCIQYGLKEDYFDTCLATLKQRKTKDNTPEIGVIDGKEMKLPGYFMLKLKPDDARALIVGKITNDCIHVLHNQGGSTARAQVTHPDVACYLIFKQAEKEQPVPQDVTQAYELSRGLPVVGRITLFNSAKPGHAVFNSSTSMKGHEHILEPFAVKAAIRMMENTDGLESISSGIVYNKRGKFFNQFKPLTPAPKPRESGIATRDSDQQWMLVSRRNGGIEAAKEKLTLLVKGSAHQNSDSILHRDEYGTILRGENGMDANNLYLRLRNPNDPAVLEHIKQLMTQEPTSKLDITCNQDERGMRFTFPTHVSLDTMDLFAMRLHNSLRGHTARFERDSSTRQR